MVTARMKPGWRRFSTRRFWFVAAIAAALTLSLVLRLQNAAADTSTNVVVTSSDVGSSWSTADTSTGGAVSFVSGPGTALLGSGSLHITTDSGNAKAQLMNYSYIGTKLADLTALSYSDYRASDSTTNAAQRIGLNIEVDYAGDGSSYTTLVYEPNYQSGGSGALVSDTWQSWDAIDAGAAVWWSTKDIPGVCAFNCFVSWSTILTNNPNAKISGELGFNAGSGWAGMADENADNLAVGVSGNTTVYDFEPTPANNVQMTVLDSNGDGIPNIQVSDTVAWIGSTDANGVLSTNLAPGTYTFHVSYNGTSASYGPVAVTANAVTQHTFQTSAVTVKLKDHSGGGLVGGQVAFKTGNNTIWLAPSHSTDASGEAIGQMFDGTYDFRMQYNVGTAWQNGVSVSGATEVDFQTGQLSLVYSNSVSFGQGNPDTAWFTNSGTELLPGTYQFDARGSSCNALTITAPDPGTADTESIFAAHLVDHNGNPLEGGSAQYAPGGSWFTMGTTDANGWICQVVDGALGNVKVGMTYHQAEVQLTQNIATNAIFNYQTALGTIRLEDHAGNGLAGGVVNQGGGYWDNGIATTDGSGDAYVELFPGHTYKFQMDFNHLSEVQYGDPTTSPLVFQTGQLILHYSGNMKASLGGSWVDFSPPTVSTELFGGTHTFVFDGFSTPITVSEGAVTEESVVTAQLTDHHESRRRRRSRLLVSRRMAPDAQYE